MSQEVPMGDIIFGVIVLAVFLIGALAVGRFLSAQKNKRFTRAWGPLIPLISGKVTHDGGGAATSWLTGTYRGNKVQASMTPDRNRYTGQTDTRYNYFDVSLVDIPGQRDWRIVYKSPVLGLGGTGWRIEGEDQPLSIRLHESGVMNALAQLGSPTIEYRARQHTLCYSEDITPNWVPTPARFQEELDLLLRLAAIHRETNTA